MKWKIAIILVVAVLLIPNVSAVRETFQDWENTYGLEGTVVDYDPSTTNRGWVILSVPSSSTGIVLGGSPFDYASFYLGAKRVSYINSAQFLDHTGSTMCALSIPSPKYGMFEIKVVGMQPRIYLDGVYKSQCAVQSVYPTYLRITSNSYYIDNILIGETDHHLIGAIPSNWTIQRDIINPAANGAYAWNPNTGSWVLKNSGYFYIDAVTDSQDDVYTENVIIKNMAYGTTFNITVVDSTIPYHTLAFSIDEFLNNPNPLGIATPDGEYRVYFENSPLVYESFWVISNGAVVETDKDNYTIGESAIVSITLLESYYDTDTYDYTWRVTNEYGETICDKPINSPTHVDTITFSESDGGGARYIMAIATEKTTGEERIIGYKILTVLEYLGFTGTVYDGPTETPLEGATVNFTQSSPELSVVATSGYDGNYTSTGFIEGSTITVNASAPGYHRYEYSFMPLGYGMKSVGITLVPIVTAHAGVGINGVTRDTVYGRPIGLATVTASNATYSESYSDYSNSVGYYQIDESDGAFLTNLRWYDVVGTKLKYGSDSEFVQVVSE